MRIFLVILFFSFLSMVLILGSRFLPQVQIHIHSNSFLAFMAKYQILALLLSILVLFLSLRLNPESKELLAIGTLRNKAKKEKWLGINGKSSWLSNAVQLLLVISLATGIFMFLGVKYSNSLGNFHGWFLPFVLIFSLTNSFSEEIIFRFGIISNLQGHYSPLVISLVSAVIFGLPHYFGNPSGVMGVVMAGVLGYILCKATLETKGLFIAWTIHFVQDIIIFTAIMMMGINA